MGDVGGQALGGAAGGPDLVRDRVELFPGAAHEQDRGAGLCEPERDAAADALAAAGDDRDLAGQSVRTVGAGEIVGELS